MKRLLVLTIALVAFGSGCSFYARGADDYRTAVRGVLDTKSADVDACYKRTKEQNAEAKGTVVVHFMVQPKTGELSAAEIVKERTTADEALQRCVMDSLAGLKLEPADQRMGDATFVWDFSA